MKLLFFSAGDEIQASYMPARGSKGQLPSHMAMLSCRFNFPPNWKTSTSSTLGEGAVSLQMVLLCGGVCLRNTQVFTLGSFAGWITMALKTRDSAKHSGEHPACFWEGFETRQSYRCLWSVKQKNRLQRKVKVVCVLVDRPRSVQREEKRRERVKRQG